MNAHDTRDTNVTTAVNDVEKGFFERVAQAYNTSQASANRMAMERQYRSLFGDIHPEALEHPDVDMDALIQGDLDPEDVPDKFKMDGNGPAQIPTADGGISAQPTPSSYSPTYTPQDLATSGAELTWDELTDAIGQHWDDDLEIHEDRVRSSGDVELVGGDDYSNDPYALRASKKPVAKILAGILRSNGDVVPEKLVEAKILQYTEHQITRSDEAAGRRYKKSEYKRVLVEKGHIVPHPDPLKDEYYTSEAAAEELFEKEVKETIADLVEKAWVLDPKEHAQRRTINPKEDASQWVADLAEFRQGLGFLAAVTSDETWTDMLEEIDDPVGELPNAKIAAGKTYNELLQQYVRVNPWARFAVAHAELDVGDDDVLTDEVSTGDDWEHVNADQPTQPMTEWVQRREKMLSPQAQIEKVSEKL